MFTLHTIQFLGTSNLLIKCCKGHTLSLDASEESNVTAGSLYARFVSILTQDSRVSFSSYAIDQILALTGLLGMPFGSGLSPAPTYTACELFFARYNEFGQLMVGANHVKVTLGRGFLSVGEITNSTNQDSEVSCNIIGLDPDNGTLPMVIATGVALPATPAADDTRFSISKATLGGIAISCPTAINISFNQTIEPLRCSSDVYPKTMRSNSAKPTISVTAMDPIAFSIAKIPFAGRTCTHANTSLFLRKRLNNQVGYEADATTTHIRFTAAGLARVSNHTSSVPSPGSTTINVTTIDDGTNAPIVITTGAAIT